MRSGLVLLLAVIVIVALVSLVRALGRDAEPGAGAEGSDAGTVSPTAGQDSASSGGTSTDGAVSAAPGASGSNRATAQPEAETPADSAEEPAGEMVRTGTIGDGTWSFAPPEQAAAPSTGTVRTYAVRVEGGIGLTAEEVSAEIAAILVDARGWQELEGVAFQQVATAEEAEFTISVASPPTVDELCLPAKTGGTWSCRIGADVALNSDRWLHATPTYDDLAEYRAYVVNHEVGHFLGHGHADCGGEGRAAPVMLQQSMDLQGCAPNAWPATAATS